ncbi:unnamed protein product, partial [Polarella glacialis]
MQGVAAAGLWAHALGLLARLWRLRAEPDTTCLNVAVNACRAAGRWEQSLALLPGSRVSRGATHNSNSNSNNSNSSNSNNSNNNSNNNNNNCQNSNNNYNNNNTEISSSAALRPTGGLSRPGRGQRPRASADALGAVAAVRTCEAAAAPAAALRQSLWLVGRELATWASSPGSAGNADTARGVTLCAELWHAHSGGSGRATCLGLAVERRLHSPARKALQDILGPALRARPRVRNWSGRSTCRRSAAFCRAPGARGAVKFDVTCKRIGNSRDRSVQMNNDPLGNRRLRRCHGRWSSSTFHCKSGARDLRQMAAQPGVLPEVPALDSGPARTAFGELGITGWAEGSRARARWAQGARRSLHFALRLSAGGPQVRLAEEPSAPLLPVWLQCSLFHRPALSAAGAPSLRRRALAVRIVGDLEARGVPTSIREAACKLPGSRPGARLSRHGSKRKKARSSGNEDVNFQSSMATLETAAKKGSRASKEPVTRDCTIHLHKHMQGTSFKKRAPKAIRCVRQFAAKVMLTKDVRVDTKLNKFLWSNGVRNVMRRVRVRLSRKRNEDEDAKEKFFTLIQHVPVESFKGLQTETVRVESHGIEQLAFAEFPEASSVSELNSKKWSRIKSRLVTDMRHDIRPSASSLTNLHEQPTSIGFLQQPECQAETSGDLRQLSARACLGMFRWLNEGPRLVALWRKEETRTFVTVASGLQELYREWRLNIFFTSSTPQCSPWQSGYDATAVPGFSEATRGRFTGWFNSAMATAQVTTAALSGPLIELTGGRIVNAFTAAGVLDALIFVIVTSKLLQDRSLVRLSEAVLGPAARCTQLPGFEGVAEGGKMLGLLDLYGFEVFPANGFEQFLINYCNERLQQFFNRQVFTCEAEEYAAEGLDCDGQWARVSTACQLPALVLLEGSSSPGAGLGPLGVFGVINDRSRCNFSTEETMSGGASAGSALTDSIANACAGHASFRRGIGRDASRVFGVKHFAGEVFYEAAHFVRKNASAHRPDIVAFLKQHGGSFVREVLAGEGDEQDAATAVTKGPGRPGRKLFGRTLISVFQQELNELCTTLEARQCRHVRCLRPNDEQKPLIFDDVSMLRQCRYSGLLEATRIRKMGYAHRRPLRAFAARYAVLLTDREAKRSARHVHADLAAQACGTICQVATTRGVDTEDVRIGLTK